ncbi:conserved protein of unknown function [Petrocella atlantisensis]|uniref:Type IV pilus assembly protein PilO n=1 Tax=Petrocella atlantisensis TaxID=2173034 RepID=A0A3P7P1W4_9FIRM|nr:type II secretion system protein M [Petrocella atlantisensis]VDN49374.1 conserved protein of unknown function [Petrocella atlantisensis]
MSNRDKRLLGILGIAIIGLILYYAVYRPITIKKQALEDELVTIEERVATLRVEYEKMPAYLEETEAAQTRIDEIQEVLPAELTQERAFKLLFDIEDAFSDINFGSVTFSNVETLAYSNELNDATTEMAIRQNVVSNLDLSYTDLKAFLRYIGNYEDRTVLTNLSMNLLEEENKITTTLVMNMYGLVGQDREVEPVIFNTVPKGKAQPFDSPNLRVTPQTVTNRVTDGTGDLFITLKPTRADGYAQIIGLTNDPGQRSYVTGDVDGVVQANLRIFIENDKYYATYEMNGSTMSRQTFEVGQALELDLYASNRVDANDQVGMNLTIVNQTELPLYINRIEEDPTKPRLNIVSTEGNVIR